MTHGIVAKRVLSPAAVLGLGVFMLSMHLGFQAGAQTLFWADETDDVIGSAVLDGPVETFLGSLDDPIAVEVAGRWLYWVQVDLGGLDSGVYRVHLDRMTTEKINGAEFPRGIAVADGRVYWTDSETGGIRSANVDGSDVQTVVSGQTSFLLECAVWGNRIYWVGNGPNKIQSANLDGSGLVDVVSGRQNLQNIAIDKDYIFWTEVGAGSNGVYRARHDGTMVERIVTAAGSPRGLDVAAGKVYFSFTPGGVTYRSKTDGTDIEFLFNGPTPNPTSLAVKGLAGPNDADFDGDGSRDISVFHPAGGTWYVQYSETGQVIVQPFGWFAATETTGDYDGDGFTDIGVYYQAAGTWYLLRSRLGLKVQNFGWAAAAPVADDYDGDGLADLGVFHGAGGSWYYWKSSDQTAVGPVNFGWSAAEPVAGD